MEETVVQETVIEKEEVIQHLSSEINTRNAFLTTLCILTFIGTGIGILGSIVSFGLDVGSGSVSLLGNGLCLFGALMMWKLKKIGFYAYVAGQVIPIVYTFAFVGISTAGIPYLGGAIWLVYAIMLIVPAAFIVMYGLHLKYMK